MAILIVLLLSFLNFFLLQQVCTFMGFKVLFPKLEGCYWWPRMTGKLNKSPPHKLKEGPCSGLYLEVYETRQGSPVGSRPELGNLIISFPHPAQRIQSFACFCCCCWIGPNWVYKSQCLWFCLSPCLLVCLFLPLGWEIISLKHLHVQTVWAWYLRLEIWGGSDTLSWLV